MNIWKNTFLMFGGESSFNRELRVRDCFNDLWQYHIEKNEWQFVKTFGDFIEPRRNHAATLI
jgi:hypothetical protein